MEKLSISEAINLINYEVEVDCFVGTPHRERIHEAQRMAIRSLEAWGKVMADLKEIIDFCEENDNGEQIIGIIKCANSINRHFNEVIQVKGEEGELMRDCEHCEHYKDNGEVRGCELWECDKGDKDDRDDKEYDDFDRSGSEWR